MSNTDTNEDNSWIPFYEETADRILEYKDRRSQLIAGIHEFAKKLKKPPPLSDLFPDGTKRPLKDICPFTVMAMFNTNMKDANRQARATALAKFLDVQEEPQIVSIFPVLPPMRARFFEPAKHRREQDIDLLWNLFEKAICVAASKEKARFVEAYDEAMKVSGVKWNITMGFYWIRPCSFFHLDKVGRPYVGNLLGRKMPGKSGKAFSGKEYLEILDSLQRRFQKPGFPFNSFPELSKDAWEKKGA